MTPDEFWDILHHAPMPQPVFYRLYHDESGMLLFYSMDDLPGTYIDIDAETYAASSPNVCVRNGKLVKPTWKTTSKLVPSDLGTMCHPDDVTIVVKQNGEYWSKQTYEH